MIYLDNAATTQVHKEVIDEMLPYFSAEYANPSELYGFATGARRAMNQARKYIAELINADKTEIYFTSGGTEADNTVLKGTAYALSDKGRHIITTLIEHHAITKCCSDLEKAGFEITYIPVDANGFVNVSAIKSAIRKDTILISVMMANNEIGTIQPIKEIGQLSREHGILFHTDAVQAYGNIPIDVNDMNIDMLSASAHKCHGPKGIGMLYIKSGIKISPFIVGGRQERKMRAGTENIPAIVGFGKAARICSSKLYHNIEYVSLLRDHMIERVTDEIEYVRLNGDAVNRLPGNVNFSFACLNGEAVQIQLDLKGICCSTGSACNAGKQTMSHVIKALNVEPEYAYGNVRFTLSDYNTMEEIDYTVDCMKEIIKKLRSMSPQFKEYAKRMQL